jgi:hypothetical protein
MRIDVLGWVMIAVSISSMEPVFAADQVPSCDAFRDRFVNAPRVLSVRLPSSQLIRQPKNQSDDMWMTDRTPAKDNREEWYGTELHCSAGKFVYATTEIDSPTGSLHPTFDLVAANIYAYTGWSVDKVIKVATEVLKSRSPEGSITATELSPGFAKIGLATILVEVDDE